MCRQGNGFTGDHGILCMQLILICYRCSRHIEQFCWTNPSYHTCFQVVASIFSLEVLGSNGLLMAGCGAARACAVFSVNSHGSNGLLMAGCRAARACMHGSARRGRASPCPSRTRAPRAPPSATIAASAQSGSTPSPAACAPRCSPKTTSRRATPSSSSTPPSRRVHALQISRLRAVLPCVARGASWPSSALGPKSNLLRRMYHMDRSKVRRGQ